MPPYNNQQSFYQSPTGLYHPTMDAVINYFIIEIALTRGYDSIVSKWKNRVCPRIGRFCAIIDNIEQNHESGSCDLTVYQKACVEYKLMYEHNFTLEPCWNILKDHQAWLEVEMPSFYKNTKGRKKSKTSETTSGSTPGGFNLNDEADESEEETQEHRPMSRDRAKKKSSASSREGSSFVDLTLHASRLHKNAWKALIAAEYVHAKVTVSESFLMVSDKPKTFLGRTLNGKGLSLRLMRGTFMIVMQLLATVSDIIVIGSLIFGSGAVVLIFYIVFAVVAHGTTTFMGKTVDEQVSSLKFSSLVMKEY
ncbi:retrovirus-related pol polyprotein from transposon TNT 1-94 [Tanacetum coccineum]|uniref:Retrovirus-related pol polyprotein from transposon TNT 1-94 n=1 Tax=Tanacetum coccineum TaxID=301880 RepID=A0ABQ5DWV6_9ASTR